MIIQLLLLLLLGQNFFTSANSLPDKVNWMLFREAQWRNSEDRKYARETKKTFVFLFDEGNAWCRRMRQDVFMNDELSEYLNKNYFPVFWHIDNYQEEVQYETNHTFDFEKNEHDFVRVLTNNRMAFPYMVILDEEFKMLVRIPGFRKERHLLKFLRRYTSISK